MFLRRTLYLTFDLMEDNAVPSNLSVPKVPEPDRAATSALSKKKKGPKPGEHVQLFSVRENVSAPGVRRASFWTRAPPVAFWGVH